MQLDRAEENKTFKNLVNELVWKCNLIFKYMRADIPQRNHLAEVGFATIWGRVRAMIHNVNTPEEV